MNFSVYNNIQNITAKNNVFKYSVDGGTTWTTITLTPGSCEIDTINSEINRLMTINDDTVLQVLLDIMCHLIQLILLPLIKFLLTVIIIGNSYLNNSPFPAIYSFPINVNTGERFTEQPSNIVYFPIVKFLVDSIKLLVSDQDGNSIN